MPTDSDIRAELDRDLIHVNIDSGLNFTLDISEAVALIHALAAIQPIKDAL
jgi:hypothetical protein